MEIYANVKQKLKDLYSFLWGIKKCRKIDIRFINRSYRIFGCEIIGFGKNNTISFEKNTYLRNCTFEIRGDKNIIELADDIVLTNVEFYVEGSNNKIQIGSGTTMAGTQRGMVHIAALEGQAIFIGKDCMLADDISIRTGDSHPIINKNGIRTNPAKSVIIGNHVWIGTDVLILKGAKIPDECIVGAKSLVTKEFTEKKCIIVGIPAKVLKNQVEWKREI